jgi:hypothetical protein
LAEARFRAGLLAFFLLGLPSLISSCGFGGMRPKALIMRFVASKLSGCLPMTRSSESRKKRRSRPKTITRQTPAISIMSYDKKRAPTPFRAVPIPDIFCPWIGKIAVTWSFFENAFDNYIIALAKSNGGPPEIEWARQNFRKRNSLFRKLCRSVFADRPVLTERLCSISTDAKNVQWQRNFILHGKLRSTLRAVHKNPQLSDLRIEATLFARSHHNRQDTTLSFDEKGLEDLFYKIAHVSGRLEEMATLDAEPVGLTSDEKSRLRDFLVANHPSLAIPNKP